MKDNFTVVYEARNASDANELKGRLSDAGVEAIVLDEIESMETGADAIGLPAPVGVAVPEARLEAARQIAETFEDEMIARAEEQLEPADEADAAEATTEEKVAKEEGSWPRCPQCQARRVTVCPVCHTSGNRFPLADTDSSGTPQSAETLPRMLLCTTCDEPFAPQYLHQCEWCGHQFADGIEAPQEPAAEPINGRLIAIILALAALLIGILVYFMILLP
jgi:hypothetical protein